jgi:hypothetical protein
MFIIILAFSLGIHAQTVMPIGEDEVLIYIKLVDEKMVFVARHGEEVITYELGEDECGDISNDGRYLALSTEQADILHIIHFASKEEIFVTDWDSNWKSCRISWIENNILGIVTQNSSGEYFSFDGESLTPITITPQTPTYPSLPDFYPIEGVTTFLQNPMYPHIYLYITCIGYQRYNVESCRGGSFIVYDTINNLRLERLENPSPNYMMGVDIDLNYNYIQHLSVPLVSWSPDGRYIAYFSSLYTIPAIPHEGKIIIYDMEEDRYLNDSPALYLPNIGRRLQWAGDNTLIFRVGHVGEGYNFHSSATIFNFFNAETETYVRGDKIFDIVSYVGLTPDRNSIIFRGKEIIPEQPSPQFDEHRSGNFVMMSTTTGESTIIDTDVISIITWRGIQEDEEWGE